MTVNLAQSAIKYYGRVIACILEAKLIDWSLSGLLE